METPAPVRSSLLHIPNNFVAKLSIIVSEAYSKSNLDRILEQNGKFVLFVFNLPPNQ